MQPSRPVALLACLVLVVSAGAVPTAVGSAEPTTESPRVAASPPSPTDNTTARLALQQFYVTQDEFETARIGMGSTLEAARDGVRFEQRRITVERQFESAESRKEERHVIDVALTDLNNRAKSLEARERAVIHNYSNGDITSEALVRELARIDASAREIETTLEVLGDLASSRAITVFDGRIVGLRFQVETLQGPVRHRASRTMAGETPSTRIFVTASDTGVVLSTLIGDTFAREATDYQHRRLDAANAVYDARNQARDLYPWAWNNSGHESVHGALTASVYRITVPHAQGELVAYMDTGSADIFREVQRLSVSDMPTAMTLVHSGNGVRVTLYRTYDGGPLNVIVEDAATGAVTNARVAIDGHDLGRTGADGLVRTIEPRAPYTVNVTGDDANFTFTVERPYDDSEG